MREMKEYAKALLKHKNLYVIGLNFRKETYGLFLSHD